MSKDSRQIDELDRSLRIVAAALTKAVDSNRLLRSALAVAATRIQSYRMEKYGRLWSKEDILSDLMDEARAPLKEIPR